jgi:hypothetical protein
MGLHREAGQPAAARRHLRVVRGGLPLQGRDLRAAAAEDQCARRSPQTGARFNFWHPDLVTLHVWLWYHNPDGLYSGTNPLVRPFNKG